MIKIFFLILILSSCSTQKLFDKFIKKGGQVNCVKDTIQVLDTVVINGDTKYIWRSEIIVKDSISYRTRWKTRFEHKTLNAKEKTARTVVKWKTKEVIKENKPRSSWWMWFVSGFVISYLLRYVILLLRMGRNIM